MRSLQVVYLLIHFFFLVLLGEEQEIGRSISIEGTWTQLREPYGIDTLIILNDEIYQSFIFQGSRRVMYSKILHSSIRPGQIKLQFYKITQGGVEEPVNSDIYYMIFELSEDALWTYSDSATYPERQFLKINSYRNTWKSQDFEVYFNRLYKKGTHDCDDGKVYETYTFLEDKSKLNLVTIKPKYPGGESSLQEYFDRNLNLPEKLDGYFGVINITFKVNCEGKIVESQILSTLFPKTATVLQELLENLPKKWTPAYDNYRYVICYTRMKFIVRNGKILVDYN